MERGLIFSEGEFYHVYNRGVEKRDIFSDDNDFRRFIRLLYVCNGTKPVTYREIQGLPLGEIERGESIVDIGAYCLMPNHFHLLLHQKQNQGISSFMGKIQTAYSMYFNKKNERSGRLFQGVFQAKHAKTDNHLKYLFAYIHLNPIKLYDKNWQQKGVVDVHKAKTFLENYKPSSFPEYFSGNREEALILNKKVFPDYFSDNSKEFNNFIYEWLTYANEI